MKHFITLFLVLLPLDLLARVYYVATDGNDSNKGTVQAPFATLNRAQEVVVAGDTVYFRGGLYKIDESQIMVSGKGVSRYSLVFNLYKGGDARRGRIVYAGYPGERPVFDFSNVRPLSRISAFFLQASYLHLKNFDIVGVQATLHGHYQSECISAKAGSNCIVENIAMHHNKAIGYYQNKGSDNLVLNCDAYCNFDDYSAFKTDEDYENYKATGVVKNITETLGGNSDGFGFHVNSPLYTGNVFRGCRAWWNSDDGFDCINSQAAVVWDSCFAFYNGFEPGSFKGCGDGNGFKAGGYGMRVPCKGVFYDGQGNVVVPQNVITNCFAGMNAANGFYANHHLGGNIWRNNTSVNNRKANYSMVNRQLEDLQVRAVDVEGYGHVLENCVSFGRSKYNYVYIDYKLCKVKDCVGSAEVADSFFASTDTEDELVKPRNPDGSLQPLRYMKALEGSMLHKRRLGYGFVNRK